jgi:NAD(P)H-hydrate epimerase
MRVLNAAQMREADARAIQEIGIPSIVLMENAGRQVVAALEAHYSDQLARHVAILCGRGNNGGDGFVVARTLHQRGVDVSVFVLGSIADIRGDARQNLEILGRLGLTTVEIADEQAWELHFSEIAECNLIVDAIFGTGLKTPLAGMMETVVADVNGSGIPVLSIDLPSGISADTPELIGDCIHASMTVTLGAPKLPLVLPPGEGHAGNVVIADIGIPTAVIDSVDGPRLELLTREEMRELLPPRQLESHKGDYGHVLVVAGSQGKTGAAYLTATGALRSGAGLVTVATPKSCLPIVAAMAPEYMTMGLDEDAQGQVTAGAVDQILAAERDVVAVGPGLGTSEGVSKVVCALLDRGTAPLVIDADALNVLAGSPNSINGGDGSHDLIITPHPGEMGRLAGISTTDVQAKRIDVARHFATSRHVYVILKGHRTLVATPDGKVFINPTGNPGMASGGSGDLLAGMVAGWLGQLLDTEAACKLAVFLHGLAGDLAEADEGEQAMTASDIANHLGDAVAELTARRKIQRDTAES